MKILTNQDEVLAVIKGDLEALKEKFGDERRTKVVKGKIDEIAEEDLVPSEDTFITISHSGYVKRLSPETYRTQKRGGKGVMGAVTKEDDFVKHALLCNTHDDLMLFTNTGRVFIAKAYDIPEFSRTAKGLPIVNLVSLDQGELITSVLTRKPSGGIMSAEEIEEGQEESILAVEEPMPESKTDELAELKGISIQRYKGLGEMNPEQLWETTMDPAQRVLKLVTIENAENADRLFDILMGKEVLPRKKFIQAYAQKVQNLDV